MGCKFCPTNVSTKITSITEESLSRNRRIVWFISKIYGHALTQKPDFLGFRNLHVCLNIPCYEIYTSVGDFIIIIISSICLIYGLKLRRGF